jgi:hypothetical protein
MSYHGRVLGEVIESEHGLMLVAQGPDLSDIVLCFAPCVHRSDLEVVHLLSTKIRFDVGRICGVASAIDGR